MGAARNDKEKVSGTDIGHIGRRKPVSVPDRFSISIRLVEEGIEAMSREEAGYWLGMSMNRKNPRRVLAALRILMETS